MLGNIIVTLAEFISNIIAYDKNRPDKEKNGSTLDNILATNKNIKNNTQVRSLLDATKITRVEPLTILSKDLINLEYTPDILNSVLNIFVAYYLQAVSLMAVVNNARVMKILDKLNPDRADYSALTTTLSVENYDYSLLQSNVSLENDTTIKANNTTLVDVANLAVGKLIHVDITSTNPITIKDKNDNVIVKNESVTNIVPVNVRLLTSVLTNDSIAQIFTYSVDSNSIFERYHKWRSGRITFIKDLIFCQDLIDEYKRTMITDESNTLQEIIRRVNNAKKFGVITRNPSLAAASNVFVISEEIAKQIERKMGGKISNISIRDKLFENTYAMLIVVVDREAERVLIYTRGIEAYTNLSIREIKVAAKGKGPDIMDILKSFNLGSPVSF